jgi:ATP-binding cassette subfamily C protein CydD
VIGAVTDAHRRATMSTLRVAFLSALVLELAATLATALVAVEVGLRLLAGHMGYQTALLVLLLTPEAYLPLRAAGAQFHASVEGATAAQRAFDILDVPVPTARVQAPARWPALRGQPSDGPPRPDLRYETVFFDAVTLSYPGRSQPALDELSLAIRPGEHVVLTGPSGAGKTSLLALLLRFTEPSGGTIRAGETNLAAIPAAQWLSQIAWVPQNPHLFAGTAAENIALGQPDADRAAIARAAGLAGAAGFIEALPDGYRTRLGERGLRLSSGQRQQIALARAFLRDAPLLLLDEPSAHLDPVSAGQVSRFIRSLMAGRTVIEVSHRGQLTPGAGPVLALALEHGRLTKRGSGDPVASGAAAVTAAAPVTAAGLAVAP